MLIKNKFIRDIKTILTLLPWVGLKNILLMLKRKLCGQNPFLKLIVHMRVWPYMNSIDLEEIKKCASGHHVGEPGEILPFCLAVSLNGKTYVL
ncbi:MAG: hypothetical protein ABIH89_08580 [Elusimicrobiota bacterium]